MKILSLIVALCFSLNVLADSGVVEEFSRALDEYEYSMSVEWDQVDKNFSDSKSNELRSKIEALMVRGLSREQILNTLEAKSPDKAAFASLRLKLHLLDDSKSDEELFANLDELSRGLYKKGANWSGKTVAINGVLLFLVFKVAESVYFSMTHQCVHYAETPHNVCESKMSFCHEEYACEEWGKK